MLFGTTDSSNSSHERPAEVLLESTGLATKENVRAYIVIKKEPNKIGINTINFGLAFQNLRVPYKY